jgi:hypothetical protein
MDEGLGRGRLLAVSYNVIMREMIVDYFFNEAAFKHGITEDDIRMAFSRSWFDGLIEGYDNKFLLTGFDTHGNILEIMYNLV